MPSVDGDAKPKVALALQAQARGPHQSSDSESGAATTPATPCSPPTTATTVTAVLVLYCASGTLLTLANKLAVKAFPFPNVIACLQNAITVVLLTTGAAVAPSTFGAMPPIDANTLRVWLPLTALFVGMLVSSLLALMHVSAVTLIVIRNLTSLTVAALEAAVLGTRVGRLGVASLAGILAGAVMYGLHDITFSVTGYAWLLANLLSTSAYQVLVKRIISSDDARAIGPLGFSYINNVLSLPMLLVVSTVAGEPWRLMAAAPASIANLGTVALLAVSGVLGFFLSVTAFKLNTLISATSMMVANNVNKFLVIIASEVFIQRTLDTVASAGTVVALAFGWLYARSK